MPDILLEQLGERLVFDDDVPFAVALAVHAMADAGSPIGSISGWLRMLQLPLDSQNAFESRTATFS